MIKNKVFLVHTTKPTLVMFLRSNIDEENLDNLFKYLGIQDVVTIPYGTTFRELFSEKESKRYIIAFNEGDAVVELSSWSKEIELEILFTYKANKNNEFSPILS